MPPGAIIAAATKTMMKAAHARFEPNHHGLLAVLFAFIALLGTSFGGVVGVSYLLDVPFEFQDIPDAVAINAAWLGVLGPCMAIAAIVQVARFRDHRTILTDGYDARATIADVDRTGTVINGRRVFEISLSVEIQGRFYNAKTRSRLPSGMRIPEVLTRAWTVRVHPTRTDRVLIDWSSPA